ncbi:BspA family leucine-rich repeat surface protein, partial [bacterium]|nr:BspA family leucine-rich repeat surface protein [bacterium]
FSKLAQNLGVSSGKTAELAELFAEDFSSDLRLDGKKEITPFSRTIEKTSGGTISARTLAEGWRYHMQKAAREVASSAPYLGFDSDIQFASTIADSTTPTVIAVTASSPAGFYTTGSSLFIEVKFSGKVFVTGTPQIKLNSSSSAFANYLDGNESDTLVFEYVVSSLETTSALDVESASALSLNSVSSLETTSALDVESASALSLNSGTIQDIVGNDVSLTLPSPAISLSKTIQINAPVAVPTFSVASGEYAIAKSIQISTATAGASVYYTTDGSAPTTSSTLYASAISVSTATTLKAIAVKVNYVDSSVAEASYTFITVPGAPTGVTADPWSKEVILSWTAPASNGGSSITGYAIQLSIDDGGTWADVIEWDWAQNSSAAWYPDEFGRTHIVNLTNGTSYRFRLAAVSALGTGSYSSPSSAVVPVPCFVSWWYTSYTSTGSSASNQIQLPLESDGTYNFVVDWGDGTQNTITSWNDPNVTHTYSAFGDGTIKIKGTIIGFRFNNSGDRRKLLQISEFGPLRLGNNGGYFYGANNLEVTASDTLDITGTTNFSYAFAGSWSLVSFPTMASWDTSQVTDMSSMFYQTYRFNQNIGGWNTSNVTNMASMFQWASAFNQNIANWNVTNVTNMSSMFSGNRFTRANYDALLLSWSSQNVKTGVTFSAGTNKYSLSSAVVAARAALTNSVASGGKGWTITDGGGQAVAPDAPTNLQGAATDSAVVLSWTLPFNGGSALTDYIIQYSLDNGNSWTTFNDGTSTTTSATVTGLTNGTAYTFRVAAKNSVGTGSYRSVSQSVTPSLSQAGAFVSTWSTDKTSTGSSTSTQIQLPLESSGTYNFTVDWGDGSQNTITTWNDANANHTYASEGVKLLTITGTLTGFRFNNTGDRLKLLNISQFGSLNLGNNGSYFYGASNLIITASDALDLTGTTNLSFAFAGCSSLATAPSMASWNTSNVTDMSQMFSAAYVFNQNIGAWNTSNVTNMAYMFNMKWASAAFNQPLGNWDTSKVENMSGMFGASPFNQNIGAWNTSNVTNMSGMFSESSFNQHQQGDPYGLDVLRNHLQSRHRELEHE